MNQFPPSPRVFHWDRFEFFQKFAEIFPAQGLPPVANETIFNQKNFNNFVWSPLGSRGNIYINFCLQVHFQVSAAWYCSHYLPPVSLIPVAIFHRRRWNRWKICSRYRWHRWQICHRCQQHKGNWWQNLSPVSLIPVANLPPVSLIPASICHRCHWLANISANFRKKSKWSQCYYQGLGGRWFMKKTWSKKSRDTVPLSNPSLLHQLTYNSKAWLQVDVRNNF